MELISMYSVKVWSSCFDGIIIIIILEMFL